MARPVASRVEVRERLGDWRWRLNNLYWITDEDGNRCRFEMNWAQADLFDEMHFMNAILKARQLGFTTFIQLFMLDACIFNSNIRAGTIAHTLDDATVIFRDKVKFPYNNLPGGLQAAVPVTKDTSNELLLGNNSSVRVGTSLRSGTLQYLHISEYGKICAKYPDKAEEVRTGALNTVAAGQVVFVESTAEGQEGHFYELCETARAKQRRGDGLSSLDFKFHFYPWWLEPDYTLDPAGVVIPAEMETYFGKLSTEYGIDLTDGQKAWYVKKAETQQTKMKREYPSTPDEAFESSVEGAYYADLLAKADIEGRIGNVPYEPSLPVETWWDLGIGDAMSIWFVQRFQRELRVIDHYSNTGEGLPHYAAKLQEKGYVYSRHCAPHDIAVRELGSGKSRLDTAKVLGIKFEVGDLASVEDGIEAVRSVLPRCWFDEAKCAEGLKSLRHYRKEWDEKLATFKNRPRHDWSSHDADAFRTGASAPDPVTVDLKRIDPRRSGRGRGATGGWLGA